ncbi:fatty acid desaturase [Turneriella parva]|uniref:Fatty acid desaturase n=1 Tax=Turneriella parva (strain ATCC BAA-1111 / DSM 21527 / NCTC 11395 / H) TaxID=869212 RepID=I4B672_TURPD|nr:fatty acid desaturase [Turneriella parva]AFM12779.1 fatty acid desaturase [Turneriella parva DSM 21527]
MTTAKAARIARLSDKDRGSKIIQWIRFGDRRLRRRHTWLTRFQDQIGLAITLGSAGGMIAMGALYVAELVPAWATIVVSGILASFLHEMEHDLIHSLYFKNSARVQNFMFWIVWLFRGNTVNPWFRKEIHLLHHRVSGHKNDVEERYISNGMPWGLKRLLVMLDPLAALTIQGPKIKRDALPELRRIKAPHKVIPLQRTFMLLWYSFLLLSLTRLGFMVAGADFTPPAWLSPIVTFLNTAAVVYLVPCWLRQAAIQIVSSNMHYYGSTGSPTTAVEIDSLVKQTQVLNSWLVLPLHLFCFNFGATHGIHHFVVNQPFYLRQWGAPFVTKALRRYGVRFNDFASMRRANAWGGGERRFVAAG